MVAMARDIVTTVNYYDDPGDGSLPMPIYVGSYEASRSPMNGPRSPYHTHTSAEKDFDDEETIRKVYHPECQGLLMTITGATRIIPLGHQVRRGPANWHSISENKTRSPGPLHCAHVDQSYDGTVIRIREQFPDAEEQEGATKRRWHIINVWRPMHPILTSPLALALADATSVPDTDLVATSIIHTKTGKRQESWAVEPNPGHKWYYKHRQMPDEVALIKCFDSDDTVQARRAAHCAVEDPGRKGMGNRESVEVRCLVF
ncbi:hypothetical protein VTI74DRAFT_4824 [Chaetomium olivicolor]